MQKNTFCMGNEKQGRQKKCKTETKYRGLSCLKQGSEMNKFVLKASAAPPTQTSLKCPFLPGKLCTFERGGVLRNDPNTAA